MSRDEIEAIRKRWAGVQTRAGGWFKVPGCADARVDVVALLDHVERTPEAKPAPKKKAARKVPRRPVVEPAPDEGDASEGE